MSGRWPPDRRHPAGADAMGVASVPDVAAAWLLTAAERGNPASTIDAARAGGRAWTVGNLVRGHVDGAAYFARLHELLSGLGPGDWVDLTDWRIDATRRLVGPGTQLGARGPRPPGRIRPSSESTSWSGPASARALTHGATDDSCGNGPPFRHDTASSGSSSQAKRCGSSARPPRPPLRLRIPLLRAGPMVR